MLSFLEKEDLIFGNVASIVGDEFFLPISNYGSNVSKNEIFLFQKRDSRKVAGQRKYDHIMIMILIHL